MSDTANSLEDLATLEGAPEGAAPAAPVVTVEPKIDEFGRAYGTGRRKA